MTSGGKFEKWKLEKSRSKFCKEMGHRLRHLVGQYNNKHNTDYNVSLGEALAMIKEHGDESQIINADGLCYWTPIFRAVSCHNHEAVDALMRAPAFDPNKRNIWGETVLVATLDNVYPDHELIQYLLSHPQTDVSIKTYSSDMFHRHPRMLRRDRGATALYFATRKPELYQYIPMILDKSGPEVNDEVVYQHEQAMCFCDGVYESRWPLTNLMNDIDEWPQNQRAMLVDCVRRMANTPSDPNRKEPKVHPRDKALLLAAKNGSLDVIEILLAAGANKELKDGSGRTAELIAKYSGHAIAADFIKNYVREIEVVLTAVAPR